MKKSVKFLVCALVAVLALAFTGCGKKADAVENGTKANGLYASIEDYINSDMVQDQMKTLMDSMEGSGMDMKMFAEGDTLVYEYYYTDIEKADGMAELLEEGLAEQASTFTSTATSLKTFIDVKNPKVEIRYIDCKGVLIYSKVFNAE